VLLKKFNFIKFGPKGLRSTCAFGSVMETAMNWQISNYVNIGGHVSRVK